MSLTLILTRHAKSSWDDPRLSDHERPLNKRGRGDARKIGSWIARHAPPVDQVLCSSALRTLETWERSGLTSSDLNVMSALYHAGASGIRAALAQAAGKTVMLIGHNPGIGDFAERICTSPPDHHRFHDYPTAATTLLSFSADSWQAINWGDGHVSGFVIPRELPASE